MNQGLIEAFFSRNASWRPSAVALKALVGTTRLAASFTGFTFFPEGPIPILWNALDVWSAAVLQDSCK
jgi:hypothetical protein